MADTEITPGARMGKAIIKGAMIGVPIALIGLTFAIFAITDNSLGVSFVTAILPGVLLGTFGGGFAGMSMTMEDH